MSPSLTSLSAPASALTGGSGSGNGNRPKLERAALDVFDAQPSGSGATAGAKRGSIPFQFNPKELTFQKSASWQRHQSRDASDAGPPEFKGAEPCKLTVEMFFNAADSPHGGVAAAVGMLLACLVPTAESRGQQKAMPPLVKLRWGSVTGFLAFVNSVQAKYTLFSPDGTPLRALCSVSLEEMPSSTPRQNPTSGGITAHRVHTVVDGDTLASVAHRAYGDPNLWREVAAVNGIDDPLRVRVGTQLKLPGPTELRQ